MAATCLLDFVMNNPMEAKTKRLYLRPKQDWQCQYSCE